MSRIEPRRVRPFAVRAGGPGPRFLGLTVTERNLRVARRAGGISDRSVKEPLPTLILPTDAVITPALFDVLPGGGCWRLVWSNPNAPLEWQDASCDGASPVSTLALPEGIVLDASTPAARRRTAWRLVRASGKPTDGWLSRHVHRKISRVLSYVLLNLGLSANHATALTLAVGLASAWLCAQTSHRTMMAGALLFWFASIADGVDGEMARLTLSESARGEAIDTAVDHLTHLLCYLGVMVGWYRQGMGVWGSALAAFAAVGVIVVLLWAMAIVRRVKGLEGYFVDTKPIEIAIVRAARATGKLALRGASIVFVLLRREAFSFTFFAVSLGTGARAIYPALVAGALAFVATTFGLCRGEIERSMS